MNPLVNVIKLRLSVPAGEGGGSTAQGTEADQHLSLDQAKAPQAMPPPSKAATRVVHLTLTAYAWCVQHHQVPQLSARQTLLNRVALTHGTTRGC